MLLLFPFTFLDFLLCALYLFLIAVIGAVIFGTLQMILLWFKRKRLVKEVEILADQVGWAAVDLSLASRQSSAQTYNYPWVRRKKKNEPVAEKIASL